jgi:hypothetical protein
LLSFLRILCKPWQRVAGLKCVVTGYLPVICDVITTTIIIIIIITVSVVPIRNVGCLRVLSTAAYQLLGTLVHSSFYQLLW